MPHFGIWIRFVRGQVVSLHSLKQSWSLQNGSIGEGICFRGEEIRGELVTNRCTEIFRSWRRWLFQSRQPSRTLNPSMPDVPRLMAIGTSSDVVTV